MRVRRVRPRPPAGAVAAVGPWTRHGRRVVYENAWITVYHDEVTRPDGQPGIYGVVHFANLAVGVVAIDDEDRVALVGQHRYTFDELSWEIPEGGSPHAEDPLEGAQRELLEETGLTARTWREIGRYQLSNSVSDEAAVVYLATDLEQGRPSRRAPSSSRSAGCPSTRSWPWSTPARSSDALSVLPLQALAIERLRAQRS